MSTRAIRRDEVTEKGVSGAKVNPIGYPMAPSPWLGLSPRRTLIDIDGWQIVVCFCYVPILFLRDLFVKLRITTCHL